MREETRDRLAKAGTNEKQFILALRNIFPHGHPKFLEETIKEMELHSAKNHDYASGGSSLGNFERGAAILAMYPGLNLGDPRVFALVLALKQVDAVLWGLSQNIQHKVEGLDSRLDDIAVYAKIVKCLNADIAKMKEELSQLADQHRVDLCAIHECGIPAAAARMGHTAESMAKEAKPYTTGDTHTHTVDRCASGGMTSGDRMAGRPLR